MNFGTQIHCHFSKFWKLQILYERTQIFYDDKVYCVKYFTADVTDVKLCCHKVYISLLFLPEGRWKVTVRTNTLPSAGTQAQVTITVYGHKGNSGAITLGQGDGHTFQPGNIDEFDVGI